MKIGICYFGLIRGFRYKETYESHKKNIYDKLSEMEIEYDVYISTYNKEYSDKYVNLIPNIKKIEIIDDEETHKDILKNEYNRFICPANFRENNNDYKMNLLKCWRSQENLRKMIINCKYDACILIDIGQVINTPIDNIKLFDLEYMYIPKFAHHYGYNGRFIIANMKNMLFFLNKLEYLLSQSKIPIMVSSNILSISENFANPPNLHPESAYKIYIEEIGKLKVKYHGVDFCRHRFDGTLIKEY